MADRQRHVLVGDLNALEYAIADYIVRWGQHLPGVEADTIAGTPCAVANMAMSVIRRNLVETQFDIEGDCDRCGGWHPDDECPALASPPIIRGETEGIWEPHPPWFARLRDRLSRRRDGDHSGRTGAGQ